MIAGLVLALTVAAATPDSGTMNTWYLHANAARTEAIFEVDRRKNEDGHQSNFDDSESVSLSTVTGTFQGLALDQLYADGSHVSFTIRRDAGTLACDGWAKKGMASGGFTIALDPAYARELQRRGIGSPTPDQQETLVLENGSYALIDALAKDGYERPTVAQLIRLTEHGVTVGYLADIKAAGFSPRSIDEIVRARDHGVDGSYLGALRKAGISGSLDDFIRARDHGVRGDDVRGFANLGYHGLTLEQLIRMRDHGVSVEFVQHLHGQGYTNLSVDDLVRLRDHGV